MFESDEFDKVLSQFEFPELPSSIIENTDKKQPTIQQTVLKIPAPPLQECNKNDHQSPKETRVDFKSPTSLSQSRTFESRSFLSKTHNNGKSLILSPKHTKRKIINSFFDTSCKRKFPGPAGLLTGTLQESKDDNICQMELLSQDIDLSQNISRRDLLESPLWSRLIQDASTWELGSIDNIKTIKQQALSGNLRQKKAQAVTAYVEAVDRSATDPLIILRDLSSSIKCTLHRDAWCAFSPYIAAENCAFILIKPTVLTTGSAFKKHYLNITLSNIFAIYSSTVLKDNDGTLPDRFRKVYEEDFTVIMTDKISNESGFNLNTNDSINENDNLLDGLDSSIFLDEIF